ncbi:T9SS type A sorting domain-containing protein [Catalinimonas alkaloidigena]|nr:T9SS type A sorting domain-containing protein [Catalinimonas alkaloidigena]
MHIIRFITLGVLVGLPGLAWGQIRDTLQNLRPGGPLPPYATEYQGTDQWGYWTGQNHLYREEFAEKYDLPGGGQVVGVISYHTGVWASPDTLCDFRVYDVVTEAQPPYRKPRLPGTLLGEASRYHSELDLTGGSTVTWFDEPVTVPDSFFVSFNLRDYAHGGFEGDTLALLHGPPGSRAPADAPRFGRNAVRRHNHGGADWVDFYSQNFTNLLTHFTLYPIVEYTTTDLADDREMSAPLQLLPVSPQPARQEARIRFRLARPGWVAVRVLDVHGRPVKSLPSQWHGAGEGEMRVSVRDLSTGTYLCVLETPELSIAQRLMVH